MNFDISLPATDFSPQLAKVDDQISKIVIARNNGESVSDDAVVDIKAKWAAATAQHLRRILPDLVATLNALKGTTANDVGVSSEGKIDLEGNADVQLAIEKSLPAVKIEADSEADSSDQNILNGAELFGDESMVNFYTDPIFCDFEDTQAEALGVGESSMLAYHVRVSEIAEVIEHVSSWLEDVAQEGDSPKTPHFETWLEKKYGSSVLYRLFPVFNG